MDLSVSIKDIVSKKFPGLFEKIRELLETSEAGFDNSMKDSHLWEHSLHVSSIALLLSEKEKTNPIPVVIASLLHDSGKFRGDQYHSDDEPEENESIRITEKILPDFGVDKKTISTICNSINALYLEDSVKYKITDIIHDSDFLSKSGALGIGAYFVKGALRGENLLNSIINSSSKELTYSENLISNMRTKAGRSMAGKNKKFTKLFFSELFSDLRIKGIADLTSTEFKIQNEKCREKIKVTIVSERICENCGKKPEIKFSFETGIKCEKIISDISCQGCGKNFGIISFCLPEICKGSLD